MQIGRICRQVALCCVVLLLCPVPCFSAEIATGPASASAQGIIFDYQGSARLLEEVEACREDLPILRALEDKNAQLDEIRNEREDLYRERIKFLETQQAELLRMNDAAIRTANLARKAGGGAWYQELFTAGKWIGLGIVLGFVGGVAK
jgi:hypothetical protein